MKLVSVHEKFGAGGDDKLIINFTWPYYSNNNFIILVSSLKNASNAKGFTL